MNKEIKRKNLLGRDVVITRKGSTKTRQVTGNKVAKVKITKNLKDGGKRITTSKMKMSPKEQGIDVVNKTRYTGAAARKRVLDVNPDTKRSKTNAKFFNVNPEKAKEINNTLSVREKAKKAYKGTNLPRRYNN
jgi:hypothetical protein